MDVGERAAAAAATAAAAAGLVAMAASSSGERAGVAVDVGDGVLGGAADGKPEWSIEVSATGDIGRMPNDVDGTGGLLAMAISWRGKEIG